MILPPKLVYVAGPISAPSKEGIEANIERGRLAGLEVWKLGLIPIIPHLNSLGMYESGSVTAERIYLSDLEILGRCDVVLRLSGWETSRGTCYETAWANFKKIPIFDDIELLKKHFLS